MFLSIIIPIYNTEKYLDKCIRSCENQNIPSSDFELVLVNDGSTDGSPAIIDKLSKEYSNIVCYSQNNAGLSEARNTGLKYAGGEYIMFVDSDDWITDNCLQTIRNKCISEDLELLRICATDYINDIAVRRNSYDLKEGVTDGITHLKRGFLACAPFTIYKRQYLEEHQFRFYPGIFHEDLEFTPRVYFFAKKVDVINDIIYHVFPNPKSITRTTNPKKCFDALVIVDSFLTFSKQYEVNISPLFSHLIVRCMNGCLHDSKGLEKNQVKLLNKTLYINKEKFLPYYKVDKIFKYKLQGLLFSIFPKHIVEVYSLFHYK